MRCSKLVDHNSIAKNMWDVNRFMEDFVCRQKFLKPVVPPWHRRACLWGKRFCPHHQAIFEPSAFYGEERNFVPPWHKIEHMFSTLLLHRCQVSLLCLRQFFEGYFPCGNKKEVLALVGLIDEVPQGLAGVAGIIAVDCHFHMVVDIFLEDLPCHAGTENKKSPRSAIILE